MLELTWKIIAVVSSSLWDRNNLVLPYKNYNLLLLILLKDKAMVVVQDIRMKLMKDSKILNYKDSNTWEVFSHKVENSNPNKFNKSTKKISKLLNTHWEILGNKALEIQRNMHHQTIHQP